MDESIFQAMVMRKIWTTISRLPDYYYLVLRRGYKILYGNERTLTYEIAIMSLTLVFNVFSLIILFVPRIGIFPVFFVALAIITAFGLVFAAIIDYIYNEAYVKKLEERYKKESYKSRRQGVLWVWIYEVLTVALFFFAAWLRKYLDA